MQLCLARFSGLQTDHGEVAFRAFQAPEITVPLKVFPCFVEVNVAFRISFLIVADLADVGVDLRHAVGDDGSPAFMERIIVIGKRFIVGPLDPVDIAEVFQAGGNGCLVAAGLLFFFRPEEGDGLVERIFCLAKVPPAYLAPSL